MPLVCVYGGQRRPVCFLDPNTWGLVEPGPRRVYLTSHCDAVFVLVDQEDYDFVMQWVWRLDRNGWGKPYASRSVGASRASRSKVWLHREIMLRTGIKPATAEHSIVDHINGNSLDARRSNLRWATHKMNASNRIRRA